MSAKHLIATTDFCVYHHLEHAFITDLQEAGLVQITIVNNTPHIPESELHKLERMIRLHNELDINIAGIEAITHLLERIEDIQEEMRLLKNSLKVYE
ncbi:MAG: MerR family transcriptional regulator [Mucilaginibacter sp.]|uniref:chaperone modulator CbpM n=1 Tax=Mucilaginibacter sp. TaxID=1882438 RepID=UPI00263160DD|nr:chaperone modulator CbpM [Mucilaginibacter sp.]MDB5004117.1 MerR family transcriptional regulator [Mucilaginibacter sp.]